MIWNFKKLFVALILFFVLAHLWFLTKQAIIVSGFKGRRRRRRRRRR